jgi:hypothetical protein
MFVIAVSGCSMINMSAPSQPYSQPVPSMSSEPGIIVHTRNNDVMQFHDGWTLTFEGIAGMAELTDGDGRTVITDTTLSYWDVTNAAPARRNSTMRQFLLTILGVILVIGLAAIILYAAFIATDR